MHHRSRHPNSSGGGGNPFTGRRLPANSPYRQQPDSNNQSTQPNLNGMAKKALLIISSFCIFFYIVSGNGVDEQQQYNSSESQYTKDLNDMKRKKQRKIQQELGNSGVQKTPTKLVLPPNDEISQDNDSQKINYDTFNNNHDSMNLDESHLGYETETEIHNTADEQEKYQYSNQFNEFNVDASKSRSGNVVDESDRSNNNNNNSNDLYRDQSNLSADGEAPPSRDEEDSNNNSRSSVLADDTVVGDESYRREDKSNSFGDTDDRGGGLRGKTKSRSRNKKRESYNQFGRVVTHYGDARRSPDNQMDTTGDRYTSDQTKVLNKRGYDDTDEKKGSSNSDGEEDNSNIIFPKSSDVGDGAFYKHQDQMAIPRLIEPDNNNSDETSRESTYMKKRHDFQTNVSGDVKKYLQSMNEQSETGKVMVSSDDNSGETNKEDEDTTYKKQFHTKDESDDFTDKERYSSVKRRSNTYKHKSVGDEDLYNKQKHSAKEVDGLSSDDVADKDDLYSSTKKRMSDTYSKKEKFDEVDSFERQTKKRSYSVEDKYAKSPSASNEDKLTEYRRDNHMQDDSKEKEETTLSEKKSIVGDNYPGSEEDLKRYASFDKHLLNGIDEVTDNTSLGKRKHSTQKQFDDLTAISNKASSLIESDYPEEKRRGSMLKDSASHSGESLLNSNTVKGLDEMNNSSYKKKQTKDVEGTELFYESRTQKEMGSSDDVKASGSGDISQNDKHAQGLEGLNTMTKPRVFNAMDKSHSEDTANTRYRNMDTKGLGDSDISKQSGSAASRSDDKPDESEYVSSKKSIPSASHVMDKPEEEEYTTKDYSEKKAQVLSNVDESAYNREYPRNSHSTDEKELTFDQAAEEQREPIDGSGNSGDDSRVKKYDEKKGSRSKKYDESEEKDTDNEKDTDLINRDTAPKLEALSFSKKNISLDDKYNDSDKTSRLNDRYYDDKKKKYSTYKQTEGIVTADEDSKSKDNENVAMEIGDLAKNRYPATKKRSPSTYQEVEDRKVDDVSGSSDTKKVMDVEDSNKDDELRSNSRGKQTLSKESHDEERPSGEVSKPSVDSEDSIKIEDASKDLSKVSKSADDNEKEMETEEKTVLLSRLRKKKTHTESMSGDEKKEKVSESNYDVIGSKVKSPLSKLRKKKKTASYAQDASNESEDDAGGDKKDIDSSVLGEKNSKSGNSNEDATERNELLSNLQIKKKLFDEEKSGDVEEETEKGDGSSSDEPNIVLNAEEESTSIKKKKKKRYRDID